MVGPAASHTYIGNSQLTLDWSYGKIYLKCNSSPWLTIHLTETNIDEILDESTLPVFRKLQLATIHHPPLCNSPCPLVSMAVRNLSTL